MGLRKEKREEDESAFVAVAPRSLVVDQVDRLANSLARRGNARDLFWGFFSGVSDFLGTQVIFGEIDPRRSYVGMWRKGYLTQIAALVFIVNKRAWFVAERICRIGTPSKPVQCRFVNPDLFSNGTNRTARTSDIQKHE